MGQEVAQRYNLVHPLGEGSQGSVWLADDKRAPGRRVAVKILTGGAEQAAPWREYAFSARLRHPSLAMVHDVSIDPAGRVHLISEFIEGVPFAGWARTRPWEEVVDRAARLLGAVSFLHSRGVLHRDIKSENVLVTAPTGLKLVDFGLAVPLGATPELSGTPAYMAPELLRGAPPTVQSDLYAVGVLLLSGLGGEVPAEGAPPEKLEQELLRLVAHHSGSTLAGTFLALIRQLLQPEPARRPGSAEALLGRLEGEEVLAPRTAAEYLAGDGLPSPTMVGREEMLTQASGALAQIMEDPPRARGLLFLGPRGCGATRLCEEFSHLARLHQVRVEWGIPALSGGSGATGRRLEPRAERALAIERAVWAIQGEDERPLLLIFDPLVDPFEQQVIAALLDHARCPIFICATANAADPPEMLHGYLDRVPLEPLDQQQTAALISSMLPAQWDTDDFRGVVHEYSGGNPQLATELTRAAVSQQLQDGGPVDLARTIRRQDPAALLKTLTALSVGALSEAQRRLAGLIALFPGGAPFEQLVSAQEGVWGEGTAGSAREDLESLLMQGVVVQGEERALRLRASSVASVLLQTFNPEQLGRMGDVLIDALQYEAPTWSLGVIAVRCGLARGRRALVIEGARAARVALELPTSELLYRALLQPRSHEGHLLFSPCAEDHGLQLELGQLLLALGKVDQAVDCLTAAVALKEDNDTICSLADALLKAGRHAEALSSLERGGRPGRLDGGLLAQRAKVLLFAGRYAEALTTASSLPPETPAGARADALHSAGLAHYYLGDMDRALAALSDAVGQVASGDDLLAKARFTNSLALVHQRRSEFEETRRRYRECLEVARAMRHLPFEATFLMNLGSVNQQLGEYAAALGDLEQSLEVSQRFGGAREIAQVQHNMGRICMILGQSAEAEAHLRSAKKLCEQHHWSALLAHTLLVEGELEMARGALVEAESRLARSRQIFEELGDARGELEAQQAHAQWLLQSDRAEAASSVALEVSARAARLQMDAVTLRALLVAGSAAMARPQPDPVAAVRTLRQALRIAEDTEDRELLVELHYQLHRALEAAGEPVTAAIQLTAARKVLASQMEQLPSHLRTTFMEVPPNPVVLARAEGAGSAPGVEEAPWALGVTGPADSALRAEGPGGDAADARLFAAMLDINRELNAEPELQGLLEHIIDHAVELTGAERGFLVVDRADQRRIEVARNIDQETIRKKSFKISRSITDQVMSTGRSTITVDAMDDRRFSDFLSVHNLRLRSVVCVPMTIRRQVRGAIYLDNRFQVEAFGARQEALLTALADQAALAIGTWELMEQNRARQEELERSQRDLERVNEQLEQSMTRQQHRLDELSQLAEVQRDALAERYHFENLIGSSAVMQEVYRMMDRVKDSAASVFISGESGTGKELVAKALHFSGKLKEGPFITANCGAISATLLESELFGYEKGAFTGAERRHQGLIERSHGGTLFLDEVGDTTPELQVKLLRVLQERRFTRIGGEREQESDFRLVTASNKDLEELVGQGLFRQDLLYRIRVIQIHLPPLHQRREDIPLLAQFLLQKHGGEGVTLSKEALRAMLNYEWPGNVRELENEIMRALAMGGEVLMPEDLSPHLNVRGPGEPVYQLDGSQSLRQAVHAFEAQMVTATLKQSRSVTEAAKLLGITRVGLHKLMRRLNIEKS